jgi:hypothetical protein
MGEGKRKGNSPARGRIKNEPGDPAKERGGEMPEPTIVPNPNPNPAPNPTPAPVPTPAPSRTFDDVLKGLPEEDRKLYESHTAGLKNTVNATREERDALKAELQNALKDAGKGSELETKLTDALNRLSESDRHAAFVEEAIKPEIGCKNIKAAYALAVSLDLFKKNGAPEWESIKKEAPELFGPTVPEGNGGQGTGGGQQTPANMNEIIRSARK